MAKQTTVMSKFGSSYDLNAVNNLALKFGVKPLTPQQAKTMSKHDVDQYLRAGKKAGQITGRTLRKQGKELRKNARTTASENYKQAKLMHGTIRQGLAELGTIGAQAVASSSYNRAISTPSSSAISQNTSGGTYVISDKSGTERGPVYAYKERDEE